MDNRGWIKIDRNIQSSWLWQEPVRLKWWLDILITVNFEPKKVIIGSKEFTCERGQSMLSLSGWAKRWGVGKSVANNFLKSLEKRNAIRYANETVTIRITVCNYDSYQMNQNDIETETKRKHDTTKEDKKLRTKNKENNMDNLPLNLFDSDNDSGKDEELKNEFDKFRKKYPGAGKLGIETEWDYFKKKYKDYKEIVPILNNAIDILIIRHDIKYKMTNFNQQWKYFRTWINGRCWEEGPLRKSESDIQAEKNNRC